MIGRLYQKIALLSPAIEVFLRKLYWHNITFLKKINPHNSAVPAKAAATVPIENIINWLRSKGIVEGDFLIVHSSLEGLKATGLQPDQIIDKLFELIGPNGTLAMPVIRSYREEPPIEKTLTADFEKIECIYDVKRTPVSSGFLPFRLMRRKGAVISHHPLNPLCAVGPLAEEMMKHNLDGDYPSPHGPNSSWRYAYDHGAKVISLGVDIEHHNTIVHVADESFGDWRWSDEEWFDHRPFTIIDENKNSTRIVVSERKQKWGLLYFTDIRLNHDLKKLGIMQVDKIGGEVEVGYVDVQRFIPYLRSRKDEGYPYYV